MEKTLDPSPFIKASTDGREIDSIPHGSRTFYKPLALRTTVLSTLLVLTLALIGLVEYAFHTLPVANSHGLIEEVLSKFNLTKRDEYASQASSSSTTKGLGVIETVTIVCIDLYVAPISEDRQSGTPPRLLATLNPVERSIAASSLPVPPLVVHLVVSAPRKESWLSLGEVSTGSPTPTSNRAYGPDTGKPLPSSWLTLGPVTITEPGAPSPTSWLHTGKVTVTYKRIPGSIPTDAASQNSTSIVYIFTNRQYFVGAFLPTIIAVLFTLPWIIVDANARNLEPFHQLSNTRGSWASSALFMDYSSPLGISAPVKALFSFHWTPLLTSLLVACTLLITPLAPEFVSIRMEGSCESRPNGCIPITSVFAPAGRVIEALLCLMVILTVILLFRMHRYSTGVFADPVSIAGVAIISHNEEVLDDFRNCLTVTGKIRSNLGKRRFKLDFYTEPTGGQSYGIVPLISSIRKPATAQTTEHQPHPTEIPQRDIPLTNPHWKTALVLIIFLLGLLSIIIYYEQTDNDDGFEHFMDSQGFGVRFLFTSTGVIIKLAWDKIFKDIVMLAPYDNLSKRSSTARDSILLSRYSSPLTAFPGTISHGQFFVAFVGLSVFLAEPLTVCLANIHFKPGTTYLAFTVSTWLSCSIIAIMIITLIAVFLRRQPELPLRPNTVGAMICYLSHSSLPGMFKDMALLDSKTRDRTVRDLHNTYGLWVKGDHPTVDVEQLDSY